jgi:hypothetical protein
MLSLQACVFYWFTRNGSFLSYESRRCTDNAYELCVTDADGRERIERFVDEESMMVAEEALVRRLLADGWAGPHGWVL